MKGPCCSCSQKVSKEVQQPIRVCTTSARTQRCLNIIAHSIPTTFWFCATGLVHLESCACAVPFPGRMFRSVPSDAARYPAGDTEPRPGTQRRPHSGLFHSGSSAARVASASSGFGSTENHRKLFPSSTSHNLFARLLLQVSRFNILVFVVHPSTHPSFMFIPK